MNKTVIIFLAICILSTHAFTHVKRETAETPVGDGIFKDFADMVQKQIAAAGEVLKPDNIKKGISDGIATVEKTFTDLKNKFDGPKVPKA